MPVKYRLRLWIQLNMAIQFRWLYTTHALLVLFATLIAGCAALERQPAVPSRLTEQATVLGIPNARF